MVKSGEKTVPTPSPLSPRERQLLSALSEGSTRTELAVEWGISVGTIHNHIRVIHAKLAARTTEQALASAIRKGWLTETPRNPAEQLMLIVTELAEACEAFRMGNPPCERPGMEQYSHAAEELADVVIRCLQMAGEHNIPLADVVMAKMAFNETRPMKHGKKF